MTVFNLSIIAIMVINYFQFGADAFDHVIIQNNKNVQKLHDQKSNSKEENHTPIHSNERHKRYDTVQHIDQYIKDEIKNPVTKRHIEWLHNTATESILALTQNDKYNFQNRKGKSQFASNSSDREYLPPSREYLPPSREYLPSSREYLPPSREYLPPTHKYLPPNLEYLPVSIDHVTETTTTHTTGTVEMFKTTQKLKNSTSTETVLKTEKSGNDTQQTPADSTTSTTAVPEIKLNLTERITFVGISKDSNATVESLKNKNLILPEVKSNSTVQQKTVLDVTENSNSTMTTNSGAIKLDLENNNCSDITESVDYHKENHHKKYDHVVHHYHHIVYHHHHQNAPNIDHHYYDVPHDVPYIQNYHHEHNNHNCGENNPTTTTMKPCSDNSKHKQHVQKHKIISYPSFSYYPHYPSYPHFPALPHYSPIAISHVSDEDK